MLIQTVMLDLHKTSALERPFNHLKLIIQAYLFVPNPKKKCYWSTLSNFFRKRDELVI